MDPQSYQPYPQKAPANKILNLLIVTVIIVILIVLGLYLLSRRQSQASGAISAPFAQNIRYPYRANDNQLYFFTGHGFASLDTRSFKTTTLGQPRVMPDSLANLDFTQNGAVIRSSKYTFFDDLGNNVDGTQLGMAVKDSRLWYVPFEGRVIYIDTNVTSSYVNFATSEIYYTTWNNITQKGEIRKLKAGATRSQLLSNSALSSDLHRIVYASGSDVYFLNKSSAPTELLKLSNKQVTSVASNVFDSTTIGVSGLFVMPSADYYVSVQSPAAEGQTSNLVRYDINSKTETEIRASFTGTLNLDGDTVVANGIDGNKLYISTVSKDQTNTPVTVDEPKGTISPAFQSSQDFIGLNELSQAVLVSSAPTNRATPAIRSGGLERVINTTNQKKIYDVSIILANDPTAGSYNVNIYKPYEKNIATFFKDVRAAGYDPNQLDFVINKTFPTGVNPN